MGNMYSDAHPPQQRRPIPMGYPVPASAHGPPQQQQPYYGPPQHHPGTGMGSPHQGTPSPAHQGSYPNVSAGPPPSAPSGSGASAWSRARSNFSSTATSVPYQEITGRLGEKGLTNDVGLNFCFINVIIQSLWHIDAFREEFKKESIFHQHPKVLKLGRENPSSQSEGWLLGPESSEFLSKSNLLQLLQRTHISDHDESSLSVTPPSQASTTSLYSDSLLTNSISSQSHFYQPPEETDFLKVDVLSSSGSDSLVPAASSSFYPSLGDLSSSATPKNSTAQTSSPTNSIYPTFSVEPLVIAGSNPPTPGNSISKSTSDSPGYSSALISTHEITDHYLCIVCSLRLIFKYYEFSEKKVIPSDPLRHALSLIGSKGHSVFDLKGMNDAEEAFETILKFLHFDYTQWSDPKRHSPVNLLGNPTHEPTPASSHYPTIVDTHFPQNAVQTSPEVDANDSSSVIPDTFEINNCLDKVCNPPCIAHAFFGMEYLDQKICEKCKASSDPETSSGFLYRIYVAEILQTAKQNTAAPFEQLLFETYRHQPFSCPSPAKKRASAQGREVVFACDGKSHIRRWLLKSPYIFSFMCAWPQAETTKQDIELFMRRLPLQLKLDKFFSIESDSQRAPDPAKTLYTFRGMILYYGCHYMSIFFSPQLKAFILLDDRKVIEIGNWNDVISRCVRGKLQPTVLFYETADAMRKIEFENQSKSNLNSLVAKFDNPSDLIEKNAREEARLKEIIALDSKTQADSVSLSSSTMNVMQDHFSPSGPPPPHAH